MPLDLQAFIQTCIKHKHATRSATTKLKDPKKTKALNRVEREAIDAERKAKEALEAFREQLRLAAMKDKAIVFLEIHSHCRCGAKYTHPNEYLFLEREGRDGARHKEALINPQMQMLAYRHLPTRAEAYYININHCMRCFPLRDDRDPQLSLPCMEVSQDAT